jgi:DNA transformation protein
MDAEAIIELFSEFGPVAVRRMFGGAGIYADGTMFALLADGVIYLKADDVNTPAFEREQLEPFSYQTKDGKRGVMSYRRMPERLYDDSEELVEWARAALAAAHRTGTRTKFKTGSLKKVVSRKKAVSKREKNASRTKSKAGYSKRT